MKTLAEALEEIKKLKCCGNCRVIHNTTEGLECLKTTELTTFRGLCEKWEPYYKV